MCHRIGTLDILIVNKTTQKDSGRDKLDILYIVDLINFHGIVQLSLVFSTLCSIDIKWTIRNIVWFDLSMIRLAATMGDLVM